MKNRIYYFVIATLLIFLAYFSYQIIVGVGSLRIVFLDVGQGDSILIQKGTRQILIDGGPSGKTELAKLGKYLPYFDREIELIIATHPDRDHIAGLIDVARNYKIGKVLATGAEKDTETFKEWKDVLAYNKIETLEVSRGTEVKFDDVNMKILNPPGKVSADAGDSNNSSVVARLDYGSPPHQNQDVDCNSSNSESQGFWCGGKNSFLLTGDIESPAEKEILENLPALPTGQAGGSQGGENVDVGVLKVAHHGSKYSSSEAFLDAASPEEAIISVGKNNSYGHPTEAVLGALSSRGVKIYRTDEIGDIEYRCWENTCKFFGH